MSETEAAFTQENRFFFGRSINLAPPKKGPAVYSVHLDHRQEAGWNPTHGLVKVQVDPGEEISGLFDQGKDHVGMYNEFSGGINLNPVRLG